MKLLLVAHYYPPSSGGGTRRPQFMAEHLRRRGHGVTVLAGTTGRDRVEDDTWRVRDPACNGNRRGFGRVAWLPRRLGVEAANSLGRPGTILQGWRRRAEQAGIRILQTGDFDLVLATYPPAEALDLGMDLSRRARRPLVADFRDGLVFEPVEGVLPRRFPCIQRAYALLEKRVLAEAAGVLAAHPGLAEYLEARSPGSAVRWLPNGFEDPPEPAPLSPKEGIHLVHTGRFGLSDPGCDPAPLARALAALPPGDPPLVLHLLGRLSRAERRRFRPLERRGRIRIHGEASPEDAREWQRRADGLVLVVSPWRPSVIPGKLLEYLPAAAPILALAPPGAAAKLVSSCGRGYVGDPRDDRAVSRALSRLLRERGGDLRRDEAAIARFAAARRADELEAFLLAAAAPGRKPS